MDLGLPPDGHEHERETELEPHAPRTLSEARPQLLAEQRTEPAQRQEFQRRRRGRAGVCTWVHNL